jgi:tetratricopeptide (TPR) repeat protein
MNSPDPRSQLQLLVSLAINGERERAVAVARDFSDKYVAAEAWRLLAEVNANLQRWDLALFDLGIALQHLPGARHLRLRRALLLEQKGDAPAALAELERLAHEDADSPQLLVHLARGLEHAERGNEAEQTIEAALRRWPVDAGLHRALAGLRWQRSAAIEALQPLQRALAAHPREMPLRLVAADLARSTGSPDEALRLLEEGLAMAPDSSTLLTSIGVLLDDLGRLAEARHHLEAAVARAPAAVQPRRNLIPTLLRLADAPTALRVATDLLGELPDDQQLIAWRATALRMLGDPQCRELFDYDRLVRASELVPPAQFADIAAFNAAFAVELTRLHRATKHPLAQSLRGGTQTSRNLPADNPLVTAFFAMLQAPIRDYIAHLRHGDAVHPVDRRVRTGYRIAGSWSVKLDPGGFHVNHVHPQGWLSSAYYVELPVSVPGDSSRAGWLKFGEPAIAIPGCEPEHFVEPRPGLLVLFPSYLWHGTVPFAKGGRRLTAAFDVLPS